MKEHATTIAQKCKACQKHQNFIHSPAENLHSMFSTWPFSQWGIDIIGPLPKAPGRIHFLLVATDYFTKWIEAVPLVYTTANDIRKFLWEMIICRFGIPHTIITDNALQLEASLVETFCSSFGIKHKFSAPYHPQANGQAEASNKTIIYILKRRLEEQGQDWVKHLPAALWAYRITPKHATGMSPFHLVFGSKAVL